MYTSENRRASRSMSMANICVRVADEMGFDKICCTELTALFYDMHEGNKLLFREMKQFPDRIIGYASLHSTRFGTEALDELGPVRP